MGWLDDPDRDYKYRCGSCGVTDIYTAKSSEAPQLPQVITCTTCGAEAVYEGCVPIKLNIRGKVAFDQNGRKAYAITDGKGNVRYISAAKQHYQETGDIVPHYTRAYEEHLRKTGQTQLLETTKYDDLVKKRKETKEIAKTFRPQLDVAAAKSEDRG